jgi:hypothetical protein
VIRLVVDPGYLLTSVLAATAVASVSGNRDLLEARRGCASIVWQRCPRHELPPLKAKTRKPMSIASAL